MKKTWHSYSTTPQDKKEKFSYLSWSDGLGLTLSLGSGEITGVALVQIHHLAGNFKDKPSNFKDQAMANTTDSLDALQ